MTDIIRDELNRPTVFKKEKPLYFDYVPNELPEREEELRYLVRLFRNVIEERVGSTQSALITGKVGTGKTVMAKKFGEMLEERKGFNYVHVNCRKHNTASLALIKVLRNYDKRFPGRGYSVEEMLRSLFNMLEVRDKYLVIGMDEIDFLINKSGPEIIYNLSRMSDDSLGDYQNRISVIYIARDPGFREKLDESTKSTLRSNLINLNEYNQKELITILQQRVELAFNPNTVTTETIDLISDIASEWGNARFAIELLWKAGKKADSEGDEQVIPEHVRWAKAEIHPYVRKELFNDMNKNHLIVLLAITQQLENSKKAYVTTGQVEENYKIICESHDIEPRGYTQFWHYIQELNNMGVIDTSLSGKGNRGRTTEISLPDIPANMLKQEIEKHINQKNPNKK
ncbi:ORC1-type DNA replication protein [Methanonatronarchaeum sp. AMET6-2]|uniref:ORC1-type DNA replication protein n=1 Tax=Methanonatronarchaeum sp. AMET6-2 TaxID=2933293 RepID=UPI001218D8D4|nr:ORC1-type DNA replication protein [Methanonatronarchaeum sp. AMET6-2]RZN63449.1 MAG: ORC1-type DNA replication protein [Methanonatronarchaeia archaeon]UOY09772.1 ORC1-type DNA replication protein [Methanonatronarchaeum sp. AMET6-2]